MYQFKPKGICAMQISYDIEDNKLKNVKFTGGCPGNHVGIENLVEGMDIDWVIDRLSGITCGARKSSCPDQLAVALKEYKEENNIL